MFEVLEINHALKHATPQSLVCTQLHDTHVSKEEKLTVLAHARLQILIDELGRGTTPLDGVSLSVAVAQWLARRGIRAFMTTHHHELYEQLRQHADSADFARLDFRHSALVESTQPSGAYKCEIDYKLRSGMSQQSYGLEIATWSDLPHEVLQDAFTIRDGNADKIRSSSGKTAVMK